MYSNDVRAQKLWEEVSVMESCDLSCVLLSLWLLCGEEVGRWRATKELLWSYGGLDQADGGANVEKPYLFCILNVLNYFKPSLCLLHFDFH